LVRFRLRKKCRYVSRSAHRIVILLMQSSGKIEALLASLELLDLFRDSLSAFKTENKGTQKPVQASILK